MSAQKNLTIKSRYRGFTLIICVSLMVLLTLIGIGLLSLSSVSLRAASQADAISVARSNARLALILAINELQKSAGPDQRITARSDILGASIRCPRLTGVWKSRDPIAQPPTTADYTPKAKEGMFLNWLVSSPNPSDTTKIDFASSATSKPIRLWDKGTMGNDSPEEDLIDAGKMMVAGSGQRQGALAWAVSDEGIKARINTPYDKTAATDGEKTAQLGSGERAGVEFMSGLDALSRDKFEVSTPTYNTMKKGISSLNSQLAARSLAANVAGALKRHTHDLTAYSTGLLVDVTTGGLKEDMHCILENPALPAAYLSKGIYQSRMGVPMLQAPADPRWGTFHQFGRLYRDKLIDSGNGPMLQSQAPTGWTAATVIPGPPEVTQITRQPPPGLVLMPTIAKVQVLFSLIGHDMYQYPGPIGVPIPPDAPIIQHPQGEQFKKSKYEYDLHLLYTPIITLHNPYNVALEFTSLRVDFVHTPFAMQIFRNGIAQSTGLVPLETMFGSNKFGQKGMVFGMNLKTKTTEGRPGTPTFTLLPGEVKMFSSYINPNRTYAQDLNDPQYWDWEFKGLTANTDALPGWRGNGIGFDCDYLAGGQAVDGQRENGHWESCMGIARDDQFHVLFAPLGIPLSGNKFIVKMSAKVGNAAAPVIVNAMEINYERPTGLQELLLGANGVLRYPKTGTIKGFDMVEHASTAIKDLVKTKPFAILSVQAKSTYGGFDADKREGRLATKPWSFAHAVSNTMSDKVLTEHPANHSHEFDLIALAKSEDVSKYVEVDAADRSHFISGHTSEKGCKFGILYDIPLAPMQTLAGLNGANPGGSSGYLPRVAQPIGNSWACPMLLPNLYKQAGPTSFLNDHSFMLNMALYDRFYFSGFASQAGPYSAGKNHARLVSDFSQGISLTDPRIVLNLPYGAKPAEMRSLMTDGNVNRYAQVAAWQKINGAFNINSTSVSAWKAMLASIHSDEAVYNKITGINTTALTKLPNTGSTDARISRFRLPLTTSGQPGSFWLGPRELYDEDLEKLAGEIVNQVRSRGPFLSMSEFVNRQLGTDTKSQTGALQQAIDNAKINEKYRPEAKLLANQYSGYSIDAAKVATYKYKNPVAGTGASYQGAPGALSQADLLNVLGNASTPRSDTFTIRAYGEARNSNHRITAVAYCEAVMQRQLEYVDPADSVYAMVKPPAPLTSIHPELTSPSNRIFGRKMTMASFRWLAKSEI